ncbi:MAG: glutaredoxin domain-containing protein [Eubacteriales bacterium]|nr:glutaredoxin domain-containing protein [Eubacteriales bacterium]
MKDVKLFTIQDCKYCAAARRALSELREENPEYRKVNVEEIDEDAHPDIAEKYDYWSVPTAFVGDEKIFETTIWDKDDKVRQNVKKALDAALQEE